MNLHSQTHYLVRAIYHPRVAAFFLAVLVTLSQFVSDHDPDWPILGLIVILVCYPHIAYWITAERYNTASGARCSLMFDSLLVGCLIIANGFYMFAGLSFIVALSLSTLFVAQPRMLAINLGIVTTVCLTGWVLAAQAWQSASLLTNALCALSLFCHSCIVGLIGFRVTASLGKSRQTIEKSRDRLVGVTRYLKRYVSPQVFSSIEINQKEIKTRRKRLTVFFSDIEGFTTLMDNLEEETVTTMLNEYLNAMAEIAIDYGGTVDKFIGDGIMVFFGDPSTRGAAEDALCCVRMALEMRRSLKPLRRKWQRDGIFSELHIRIGINTGYCAVGNFGSENRMDYTAVGGTVNIASRLETSASRDGISISGHTYQLISRHIKCIEKEPVMAKGIRRPIENYSVVTERQDSKFCIVEQDIKGLHISMNPVLVDIHKARTILKEVEASIARIEQNQIESTKRINRLG